MKRKQLREKELSELRKLLRDHSTALVKTRLEYSVKGDKNVKKVANIRREIAIISGMVSARSLRGEK